MHFLIQNVGWCVFNFYAPIIKKCLCMCACVCACACVCLSVCVSVTVCVSLCLCVCLCVSLRLGEVKSVAACVTRQQPQMQMRRFSAHTAKNANFGESCFVAVHVLLVSGRRFFRGVERKLSILPFLCHETGCPVAWLQFCLI